MIMMMLLLLMLLLLFSGELRALVPLLKHRVLRDRTMDGYRKRLLNWDYKLEPTSVEAGIYVAWERALQTRVFETFVAENERRLIPWISMRQTIDALIMPDASFGEDPLAARDALLLDAFRDAIATLTDQLGKNPANWTYGQADYKHAYLPHPMTMAVDAETRKLLDVGPIPRGGNSYTVNNTGSTDNQRSGASFRIIVDTGDWDACLAMNNPGQSYSLVLSIKVTVENYNF